MRVNQKKLARQLGIIDKWIKAGCKGTVEAVTGFGKTYVAILAIKRFHSKYPGQQIDVVLPTLPLKEDWTGVNGHIVVHDLHNVFAFVVNSYTKFERRFPAILILDEVHNYASNVFGKVFSIAGVVPVKQSIGETPFVLGLTATLERNDGKHSFIEEYCPIIDTVSLEEAKREGYISKFKTYNLGLEFNEEDRLEYNRQHDMFNNAFAKFNHHFELAMACSFAATVYSKITVPIKEKQMVNGKLLLLERMMELTKTSREWCVYFAYYNEWDNSPDHPWSPTSVSKIAQQFSSSMRNRKKMIYTASVKLEAIKELIDKFPVQTITFGEDSDFADRLVEYLDEGICRSYHSKIKGIVERQETFDKKGNVVYKDKKIGAAKYKQRIVEEFKAGAFRVLSTVKALDEGFDDENVILGIQASYTSTKRQNTQRTGRTTRKETKGPEKMALVVNLYIKDTQEHKWLNDKQRGIRDVEWVESIDDITFDLEEDFSLV